MSQIDYKSAGVDIDAGNEAVRRIRNAVTRTHRPEVLAGIGSFGAFFDLTDIARNYRKPVLVQSIDGVGTKVTVARMAGRFRNLGHDVVSACCNDIIVHGARPLTFLDYIANEKLDPAIVEELVSGMADACCENGISLVGGETAEMPSTYRPGEHDLVGVITGVVERDEVIDGQRVRPGEAIIGVFSNGLHTNGYSLARKAFFEIAGHGIDDQPTGLDGTLGEVLLRPHLNYTRPVLNLLEQKKDLSSIAHITGGGFIENLPRVLPPDVRAEIRDGLWPVPPVFELIREITGLPNEEMFRTFNMGIGLTLVCPADQVDNCIAVIRKSGPFQAVRIGTTVKGPGDVVILPPS